MMLVLILYSLALALLLGLAALALEPVAARCGWPRRGCWLLSLLLSLLVPGLALVGVHPTPIALEWHAPVGNAAALTPVSTHSIQVTVAPAAGAARQPPVRDSVRPASQPSRKPSRLGPFIEETLKALWLAMSAVLLASFVASWAALHRRSRHWRWDPDLQAWVTPAVGPAVLGFWRPRILIPQWVLSAPATIRAVMAHERQHVSAHDPLCLLPGLLAVLAAPWNLALWWQLRRLRLAIEIDCDARVLAEGVDVGAYGEALLSVSACRAPPLGAMSISTPASFLERRVRIMTSAQPHRTAWWAAGALGLSLTCIAAAVELPAPTLSSDGELQKPPPRDWSPFLPKAEAAARAAYPELFAGRFAGTVALEVDMDLDGHPLQITREQFPAGPLMSDEFPPQVTEEGMRALRSEGYFDLGANNRKFEGWYGPQHTNGLYLFYSVRKWPHDPKRSADRVRAAVAARYPEYFKSYADNPGAADAPPKLLTVFMNDDGTIDLAELTDYPVAFGERAALQRFGDLGLTPEQISYRGLTSNRDWLDRFRYANAPNLQIQYAWPRHPGDPPDPAFRSRRIFKQIWLENDAEQAREVSEQTLFEHYFPDVWQRGLTHPGDMLWMFLDRQGNVWDTGRRPAADSGLQRAVRLESRYPGAVYQMMRIVGVQTVSGQTVSLEFLWLADDSPVMDRSQIDPSRRADVFLEAMLYRDAQLAGEVGIPLRYGATHTGWLGPMRLAFTATAARNNTVLLRVEKQDHPDAPASGETAAVSTPESQILIANGTEASLTLPGADGRTWRLVMLPQPVPVPAR